MYVSSRSGENVLTLNMVMAAQLCEYTENTEWYTLGEFMVGGQYLNKAVKKKTKASPNLESKRFFGEMDKNYSS